MQQAKRDKPQQGAILNEKEKKKSYWKLGLEPPRLYSSRKLDNTVIDGTEENRKCTQ